MKTLRALQRRSLKVRVVGPNLKNKEVAMKWSSSSLAPVARVLSLRQKAFGLFAAALTSAALCMPAGASVPAFTSDLGLKNVRLSCSNGTLLQLALSTPELTALSDAVTAINLYPVGDPRLTCSLAQATGLSTAARLSAAASSSDASSGGGPKDFAVGGGNLVSDPHRFGFNAHSGPNGEDPGGEFSTQRGDGQFTFEVTCLRVDGNRATLAGPIRNSTGVFEDSENAKVTAVDNGQPSVATDFLAISTGIGTDCNIEAPVLHPVTNGNLAVNDR
jgi:hypothetical protein